jgi:hypothetical protein
MSENNIQCKGNMLKAVITRIDYDDLYELEKDTLKELKRIAVKNGLTMNMVRELDEEEDFQLNDPMVLRELPAEYIRTCMCNAFFNENLELIVEVNQFFIRVIHKVDKTSYDNYENSLLPVVVDFIKPILSDELILRRISIKKVDETNFKEMSGLEKYFKSEIVQRKIFGDEVRWDIPSSGSTIVQNFQYENKKVNFYRKIDRVSIRERIEGRLNDNIYYKMYLEYEVYDRLTMLNVKIEEIKQVLTNINSITRKLFLNSFTEEGWKVFSQGGEIGDYESNE